MSSLARTIGKDSWIRMAAGWFLKSPSNPRTFKRLTFSVRPLALCWYKQAFAFSMIYWLVSRYISTSFISKLWEERNTGNLKVNKWRVHFVTYVYYLWLKVLLVLQHERRNIINNLCREVIAVMWCYNIAFSKIKNK